MCTLSVTCRKEHWVQDQEAWRLAPCQPLTRVEKIITTRTVFMQHLLSQLLQREVDACWSSPHASEVGVIISTLEVNKSRHREVT